LLPNLGVYDQGTKKRTRGEVTGGGKRGRRGPNNLFVLSKVVPAKGSQGAVSWKNMGLVFARFQKRCFWRVSIAKLETKKELEA